MRAAQLRESGSWMARFSKALRRRENDVAFHPGPDRLLVDPVAGTEALGVQVAVDAGDVPMVSGTLEELYRHIEAPSEDLSWHLDVPSVAARRIKGSNVSWSWISLPARDPEGPAERREFFEFDPQEGKFVTSMTWDRDGDAWRCATFEGRDDNWGMAHLAYLGRFGSYARGDLEGRDTLDGRPAYRFSIRGDPAWEDQTYWLDADTLWLRQYEYERDGIHYTVKLEAVNEDIHIEPPDVIVECGEGKPPSGTVSG